MSSCPISSSTTSPDRRSPRSMTTISRPAAPVCRAYEGCCTTSPRSSNGSTSSRSTSTSLPLIRCTVSGPYSTVSRTCVSGSAYRSPPVRASRARTIARVIGRRIVIEVPSNARVCNSTEPPSARAFDCTASTPTPRPDNPETASTVENPGCAMQRNSCSSSSARTAGSTKPIAFARASTFVRSMPRPSSLTLISTAARSRAALSVSRPARGFPSASRTSGVSMP